MEDRDDDPTTAGGGERSGYRWIEQLSKSTPLSPILPLGGVVHSGEVGLGMEPETFHLPSYGSHPFRTNTLNNPHTPPGRTIDGAVLYTSLCLLPSNAVCILSSASKAVRIVFEVRVLTTPTVILPSG